jgi:integrase
VTDEDGTVRKVKRCVYTPHSLRATTATLLLDAGVDIIKVKELLGHRYVTTTQIYDKRRRSLKEGASHDVPIYLLRVIALGVWSMDKFLLL